MKTVNIYDLKDLLVKHESVEYMPELVAVITNNDKYIIVDVDGCHQVLTVNGKYSFIVSIKKLLENNSYTITSAEAKLKVSDIIKLTVKEEKTLNDFVRRFGARIETNYRILLRSIKEIGLNPEDYPRALEN